MVTKVQDSLCESKRTSKDKLPDEEMKQKQPPKQKLSTKAPPKSFSPLEQPNLRAIYEKTKRKNPSQLRSRAILNKASTWLITTQESQEESPTLQKEYFGRKESTKPSRFLPSLKSKPHPTA